MAKNSEDLMKETHWGNEVRQGEGSAVLYSHSFIPLAESEIEPLKAYLLEQFYLNDLPPNDIEPAIQSNGILSLTYAFPADATRNLHTLANELEKKFGPLQEQAPAAKSKHQRAAKKAPGHRPHP